MSLGDVRTTMPAANPERAVPALTAQALDIDAQSLFFFLLLFRTGSVGDAAEQLHVSLSSANRMLAKLRNYWNDPLFVRQGLRMTPTAGARLRYGKVLNLISTLESLQTSSEPDARTLQRTVRIATYDSAFALCIGATFEELTSKFPGVRFQAYQADEHLFDDVICDRLDMVFFARQGLPPGMHSMPMLTTPYVCVVKRGHPLEKTAAKRDGLDRADLFEWRQVLVNAQPDRTRAPNSPANGWFNPPTPDKIAVVMPFFLAVPLCLRQTDCYAVVPKATALTAFDPEAFSFLDFHAGAPVLTTELGWHDRTHSDPGFQLIRSVLKDIVTRTHAYVR